MRRVVPDHVDLPLDDLYAGLTLDDGEGHRGAWLAVGMVSAADGAATIDGRTDRLGAAADAQAFHRLRAACDAILVGAGTVRAEGYGPPIGTAARRDDRRSRGLDAVPRLVIVSGSLDLDPRNRVFADPVNRPIVVTGLDAPEAAAADLDPVADLVRINPGPVDLSALLVELGSRGLRRVLCEGGPTLNASLLAADLVDELFVTVTPVAVGGEAPRIALGPGPGTPRVLRLRSVHEHEGELLLRYRRDRCVPRVGEA